MPRFIGINSQELLNEMKRRGPEILHELGPDIDKALGKNKNKYFNEVSRELAVETKLSVNDESVDIRTNAIGFAYDSGEWDHPDVKAEMKKRKEIGYYRAYSRMRRKTGLKGKIKGKKRIPFIMNSVWTGGKELRKRINNNAGK